MEAENGTSISSFLPCRSLYSLLKGSAPMIRPPIPDTVSAISQRVYRLKTIDEWLVSGYTTIICICIRMYDKKESTFENNPYFYYYYYYYISNNKLLLLLSSYR